MRFLCCRPGRRRAEAMDIEVGAINCTGQGQDCGSQVAQWGWAFLMNEIDRNSGKGGIFHDLHDLHDLHDSTANHLTTQHHFCLIVLYHRVPSIVLIYLILHHVTC